MNLFETERLFVRPLTIEDLDGLFQLYKEFELMRYITGRARTYQETDSRLRANIADYQQNGFGLCALVLKTSGAMIGRGGIEPIKTPNGLEGDIAWMFAKPFWGKGLATEFGKAMISYGFTHYPIQRIFATADHQNIGSIRVMEKLGMRFVKANERGVEYELFNINHTNND